MRARACWVLLCLSCGPLDGPTTDGGDSDAGEAVDAGDPPLAAALADEALAHARPWVEAGWMRGVSVGASARDGTVFRSLGRAWVDGPAPGADTLFEIGSITKTFTATLLAEAVRRGETAVDATLASRHADLDLPVGGSGIRLEHLAMHVSGLPRMPTNFAPADPLDPYVDYGEDELRAFLSGHRMARAPGAAFEYSNLGFGLLGWSLSRGTTSFEGLLRERILDPLGLGDTRMMLDASQSARFAQGSDPEGEDVPAWHFDVLGPAGGLRSSARDVLAWAVAHLDPAEDGLGASLRLTQAARREVGAGYSVGLGWFVVDGIVQHDGAVGGMQSFVAFWPERGTAVVLLANSQCGGCGALWRALPKVLEDGAQEPVAPVPEVALEPAQADRLVGAYAFPSGSVLSVKREGARMWTRLTGQEWLRIHPAAEDRAVLRVVEAELEFGFEGEGPATSVVLFQNGGATHGTRLEE